MLWKENDIGTIMLGTAQLGMNYGIANKKNLPPDQIEADAIVENAWAQGVKAFDTAQDYGKSESVLGKSLVTNNLCNKALIVTKFPLNSFQNEDACCTAAQFSKSALQVSSLFGVLCHSKDLLMFPEKKIGKILSHLKKTAEVQFTGISVYTAEDALTALDHEHIDIVQMPLNVLDRAAIEMGVIAKAKKLEKLVVFRSTFLQGLLLMNLDQLPKQMEFAHKVLADWIEFYLERELNPVDAAVQIAIELANGFPLLIGAESASQVKHTMQSSRTVTFDRKELAQSTLKLSWKACEKLKNPALWNN